MRTVTYTGPYRVVELETAPGRWHTVERGDSIEVSDALAESLVEQVDNWVDADATPDGPPAGSAATVLEWVGDDPERAGIALDAEQAGKNRSTLITQLEALIEEAANV